MGRTGRTRDAGVHDLGLRGSYTRGELHFAFRQSRFSNLILLNVAFNKIRLGKRDRMNNYPGRGQGAGEIDRVPSKRAGNWD